MLECSDPRSESILRFCRAMLCINKRGLRCRAVSVTFVYFVETAKDTTIVAMECE